MAFAPSPNDGPLDDVERALLDGFYQGIAPKQSAAHAKSEGQKMTPDTPDDGTKVIAHPGSGAATQSVAAPDDEKTTEDAGDDPFAALKGGGGNRSTIDLPGPRSGYRVEETSSGNFTIEHLASGEEVRVSGVDYLRFSDLQLHSEFLTRTNPSTPPQTAAEPTAEPAPEPETEPSPPVETPLEEDKAFSAEAPSDEAPDTDSGTTVDPETDYDSAFTAADDGSITFSAEDLLGGPSGPGGADMRVVAVAGDGNGALVDNGNDSWTFTPDEAFDGNVELKVTIADGQGGIETAMATIEITPAPDTPDTGIQSPEASDDAVMTAGSVVKPADDGDTMTYALVSGPAEGTVSVHADGSYSFDPGSDFEDLGIGEFRDVCFIYHATDGQGGSDSGIVTITVTGSEEGPVASERSLVAPENSPIAPSQADPQSEPNDNGGGATLAGGEQTAADVDAQSPDNRDDGAISNAIQDRHSNGTADDGPEDRNLAETADSGLPEEAPAESPFAAGLAGDNLPRIDAGALDMPDAAKPMPSIDSGDDPSCADELAAPPREQSLEGEPTSPSQTSHHQEVSQPAAPIQPRPQDPSLGAGLEKASIQTDPGNEEPRSDHDGAPADEPKPNETIDLSTARNWTVTYANGDSFTANDTRDASLFTDTAGTIDFGNGDQVKFENIKKFTW